MDNKNVWAAIISAGGLCSMGCSAESGGGSPGVTLGRLRALTFNTALAPGFEPLVEERSPEIRAALVAAADELDVLCVQEYWDEGDFAMLREQTATTLPNVLRQPPEPGTGECSEAELGELGGCLGMSCAGATGVELVACGQQACAAEIGDVRGGCLGCMLGHLDGSFEACVGAGVGADSSPGEPALFGGTFDVALLSRYAMTRQATLQYDAYFVRASAHYARMDVPGIGEVDTFCTHLGSSLGVIPYQGPFGSWEGEHAHQIDELVDFMAANADGSRPTLLLGDLNTGPAVPGDPPVSSVLESDYAALVQSGLSNAWSDPACTLCSDNSYRSPDAADELVDHVLVRGFSAPTLTVERAMTERLTVGDALDMNLSDHYGLRFEARTQTR